MSGGVDSSVSAALLLREGYDVVGVFIKVWQADFLPCTWREERREAMRAAAHLRIPFLTLDLEKEYKEGVVDYMIREYARGRVPNPDVMCNKEVKFGAFLKFARTHGADMIATGHYARVLRGDEGTMHLLAGKDPNKDQSYFLWTLTQEQLVHTLFPVGDLLKSEVRALAREFGLPNAEKKDSQGLCFMGQVHMADFLKHYLATKKGAVLDTEGNVIGEHDGAMLYTIGQRHGFSTIKRTERELPYFVLEKDIDANTITVGHRDPDLSSGSTRTVMLEDVHFINMPSSDDRLMLRLRYRDILHSVANVDATDLSRARLSFAEEVEGVAPGQSAVWYRDEECLGGGIVAGTAFSS